MIDVYLSDLFFNHGPAERAYSADAGDLQNQIQLYDAAAGFLGMAGDLAGDVSAQQLVDDFLNRL
jgi:hypothetical protein